jgi:hypothetical protein
LWSQTRRRKKYVRIYAVIAKVYTVGSYALVLDEVPADGLAVHDDTVDYSVRDPEKPLLGRCEQVTV